MDDKWMSKEAREKNERDNQFNLSQQYPHDWMIKKYKENIHTIAAAAIKRARLI